MQIFDYCSLIDDKRAPHGAGIVQNLYPAGDGVQFRSLNPELDLLSETVWLSRDAYLLAADAAAQPASTHRQIVQGSDWIHIQFRLQGGGAETLSCDASVETPERTCTISRYPQSVQVDRAVQAAERWKFVCLYLSPKGLGGLLDASPDSLPTEFRWLGSDSGDFQSRTVPLTSRMAVASNDILSCTYQGGHRRTFMRAKSLELLASVFDSSEYRTQPGEGSSVKLTPRDVERIAKARTLMLDNLDGKLTLAALAREVGVNRTKLAIGFKRVYGVSVQAFWRDAKLARARELLQGGRHSATDIAFDLGYSELSSFTRAFVRQFGVLPRECRRGRA